MGSSSLNNEKINNCLNTGHIISYGYAGGIAYQATTISNCYNIGIVDAPIAGCIVGRKTAATLIINCD